MLFDKVRLKKIDFYSFIFVIAIFLIDRISKSYFINLIQIREKELFVNDFLNITLNWNTGIGFGLLSVDSNTIYNLISILIFLIIIYLIYLMVKSDDSFKIMISLVIGGAVGNLYDRLNYFAVPDFIDFHFKGFHWFTFNFADIFISLGIFLIIMRQFFTNKL
tara:strand:- start:184 stop:672 length:489 start_codon:yes stop_codon:yes gene_type:complete